MVRRKIKAVNYRESQVTDLLSQVAALRETARARKPLRDKPRHLAEAILLLPTEEARKLALEQVPEDIRHLVRFYVADALARRDRKPLPDLEKTPRVLT